MISESEAYIEAYFRNELADAEKRQFEERCVQDVAFAKEVALYISSREAVRQQLLAQKQQQWAEDEYKNRSITPARKIAFPQWLSYVAAASLLLAVAVYFLFLSQSPHQLANNYIEKHFMQLSQTMGASRDSLQLGIAAYNNKDYRKAL